MEKDRVYKVKLATLGDFALGGFFIRTRPSSKVSPWVYTTKVSKDGTGVTYRYGGVVGRRMALLCAFEWLQSRGVLRVFGVEDEQYGSARVPSVILFTLVA